MARDTLTGSRIRERRGMAGIRQSDLAREVGISASYLNLIEHNRRRIGGKLLLQIAEVLRVEPALLSEGAEAAVVAALREAAADRPAARAELDRIDEFAGRFPGWARLAAELQERTGALERTVEVLTDRLTHDPHLAASLHEVLSTVTAIRSTAAILSDTAGLEAEWRDRFQRNIREDSKRLAESAQALVTYLDGAEDAGAAVTSPQEEIDRHHAEHGYHVPALEADAAADAAAGPAAGAEAGPAAGAEAGPAAEAEAGPADEAEAGPADEAEAGPAVGAVAGGADDAAAGRAAGATAAHTADTAATHPSGTAKQPVSGAAPGQVPERLAAGLASATARYAMEAHLRRYVADAQAMPLADVLTLVADTGPDPLRLARAFGTDCAAAIRRLATLPEGALPAPVGAVICDASGTLTFRKPIEGFPLPRFGAACPFWPLFRAFARPMVPLTQLIRQSGRDGATFRTYAVAAPVTPPAFNSEPLLEATMLVVPAPAAAEAEAHPVGSSCRICPQPACAARREPSILADGL